MIYLIRTKSVIEVTDKSSHILKLLSNNNLNFSLDIFVIFFHKLSGWLVLMGTIVLCTNCKSIVRMATGAALLGHLFANS